MNAVRSPRVACVVAVAACTAGASLIAAPLFEVIDLFEEKTDGVATFRIPSLVVTAQGSVLAVCEARRTSSKDWGEVELHLRRSTDGGTTFSPARQVAHLGARLAQNPVNPDRGSQTGDRTNQTVNNPVLIADRDGSVILVYCVEYMRCFCTCSTDDGLTWSEPREITDTFEAFRPEWTWKVIATGPGHGIQLASGRLVVPVWLATSEGTPHGGSVAATVVSDDHGATWRRGDIVVPASDMIPNANESAVVELGDGRVMFLARNHGKANRKAVSFSSDGATGWSEPAFVEDLIEPVCMAGLVRGTAADGGTEPAPLVFSIPLNLRRADGKETPGGGRDRRNLTVQVSRDDGQTWPMGRTIEAGPSAYSDLAVLPDGTILCLFERGRGEPAPGQRPAPYSFISLARFNLEWVAEGTAAPATTDTSAGQMQWRRLPDLADPVGVAGPFVGVHQAAIVVAGGANFPVAEGEDRWQVPKIWHDEIWVLAAGDDGTLRWSRQPPLPRPLGYGATASTPAGVVCVGGEDGKDVSDAVTLLEWNPATRRLSATPLPSLPTPLAFSGAAAIGSTVYVAGGQHGVPPVTANAAFHRLPVHAPTPTATPAVGGWERLPDVPGGPRTHPIVVAQPSDAGGRILVMSGRRPSSTGGDGAIEALVDCYEFDPVGWEAAGRSLKAGAGWRRLADMPAARMAGVAFPVSPRTLAVVSGDDGVRWSMTAALKDTHPGFPPECLIYDRDADRWATGGRVPSCQLATTAVPWGDGYAVVTGEIRPRVRTPAAWSIVTRP